MGLQYELVDANRQVSNYKKILKTHKHSGKAYKDMDSTVVILIIY